MADFLYNGMRLPGLPDTDLPFKYIFVLESTSSYTARLVLMNEIRVSNNSTAIIVPANSQYYRITWGKEETAPASWGDVSNYSGVSDTLFKYILWTNFDLYNADGTVYLAASEPVPVTDHNARIMGWIVGKRLAAQRGKA